PYTTLFRSVHDHDVRQRREQRDRREVLDDVVSEIGRDGGIDGVGDGALQQRVAVVRRMRHEIGGDVAAGAAAVLDDELLAELLAERLRQHARGDVARGAGTEADDDAHRPRRIALRLGDWNGERGSAGYELQKSTARKCHGVRSLRSGWRRDPFCLEYWIAGRDLPRGVCL